jgi:hypothetical protein
VRSFSLARMYLSDQVTLSSEGNLVHDLDGANPSKLLLAAIERLHDKPRKDDEYFLGVLAADGGVGALHHIISGDPSRGTMALATDNAPLPGTVVQVWRVLVCDDERSSAFATRYSIKRKARRTQLGPWIARTHKVQGCHSSPPGKTHLRWFGPVQPLRSLIRSGKTTSWRGTSSSPPARVAGFLIKARCLARTVGTRMAHGSARLWAVRRACLWQTRKSIHLWAGHPNFLCTQDLRSAYLIAATCPPACACYTHPDDGSWPCRPSHTTSEIRPWSAL